MPGAPGKYQGVFYWLKHPIGWRPGKEQQLLAAVKKIHQQSNDRYGRSRTAVELRERGISVSRNRVARLMRKHGIRSIICRKYRMQTIDSNHGYAISENYLNRDFFATKLAEKWVSNLTYIRTQEGWLYLTAVLDEGGGLGPRVATAR